MEKLTSAHCKCGGLLKKSKTEVEFFGIDFGIRSSEVCTRCCAEYLSQELIEEIEDEVKRKGLFGLERKGRIAKSGNSLVIRVPKEIADSLNIGKYVDYDISFGPKEANCLNREANLY
jgi:hypothetical protein